MPPKVGKPINVVEIDSSDDEMDASVSATRSKPGQPRPVVDASFNKATLHIPQVRQQPQQENAAATTTKVPTNEAVESRSFWKAGTYTASPISRVAPGQDSLEHARVHPKFLHSNATSHKWAFGAIAELLDNAVDEVQNGATFVKVDKVDVRKDNSPALLFVDDGGGMTPERLRKCMSLGYSTKKANTTIGQYGNGFKTSTMRLGADVIVFSRATCASKPTQSIGLLSYTFLRKTGQDDVIIPMVDFDISGHWAEPIIYSSQDDWSSNLETIIEWSPFTSKSELLEQFEDIGSHGTKIIIYNLWLNDEGIYELNFDDDDKDIRLRDELSQEGTKKSNKKTLELRSHISYCFRYSLRAYASMLYLRKFENFKIILRGEPVEQFNIADELKFRKVIQYKPQLAMASKEATVETTIGFLKEAPSISVSGVNVYHKNRLIRPFWKVTGDGSSVGNGVVGVLEANFIEPAHDKQDFERSPLFFRLESRLKQMIVTHWRGYYHLIGEQLPDFSPHFMQKGGSVQSQVGYSTKTQRQLPAHHRKTGLSSNIPEEGSLKQPVSGLPANSNQDTRNRTPAVQLVGGLPDGYNIEVSPEDGAASMSVDEICEENIQLFMRCEDYRQKETQLKQLVEELEKQVEQARRKCAQLSSHLEVRKKQKNLMEQMQKAP